MRGPSHRLTRLGGRPQHAQPQGRVRHHPQAGRREVLDRRNGLFNIVRNGKRPVIHEFVCQFANFRSYKTTEFFDPETGEFTEGPGKISLNKNCLKSKYMLPLYRIQTSPSAPTARAPSSSARAR